MKRVTIRSKDLNELIEQYHIEVKKKDTVELLDDKIILINKIPSFFYHEKKLIPTLKLLQENNVLKIIVVDMGAVRFVVQGADVMRPGIVEIAPDIKKGDPVVIIDVNNRKPLTVGIALFDAKEMQEMKTGKVIKNIHYVGDEIWKAILQ